MLNEDLIFLNKDFKTDKEFLENISDELLKKGYVKESFKEAILKREEEFPTAIGTIKYNLAIPHTDSKHVNKPGIALVKFNNKCKFKEMCTNNEIGVDIAFVLLVTEKEKQVQLLSKLMEIFSQSEFLEKIYKEENSSKIVSLLNDKLI
ncbi:PTS sugar transporter subunit IIA [Peptacetobacter sp.]|uniref:PTS sugar transporter subunit IIA n=1 Tax=Peptacetobacter sp. TaxID=2991975 RepID=UPI00261F101E|nr:PTS sugar transporter subunit IIA [Peptacetobacter sp.]